MRDVIGRCIYGVDINPMSVELCKVSLWMEAIEPGKPLSFLEQHIQCGNSLLGATPALLAKVVDLLDHVPMEDRDTKGDLYEYMLGRIATAGQNGQFRTPRHIIRLMVEMVQPKPTDIVCDPACGTCGFLVAVGEYLRERHPEGAA